MALSAGLQQGMADPGPQADHRLGLDAQPCGDRIGGAEADAADVARQAVGVLGHHLHGVLAVGLEDPHRPGRTDAMAVQKDHDLAHHLLIGPGLADPPAPHRSDAGHLPQALRCLLDHLEHLIAEGRHELAGIDRADAADHSRAQIPLDSLGGGGRRSPQEGGLELLTVLPAVHPGTAHRHPFAGADRGGMAHDRDQVAMAAGLDAQHAEAVLGVMEGDALDRAREHLGGLGAGLGLIGWRRTHDSRAIPSPNHDSDSRWGRGLDLPGRPVRLMLSLAVIANRSPQRQGRAGWVQRAVRAASQARSASITSGRNR